MWKEILLVGFATVALQGTEAHGGAESLSFHGYLPDEYIRAQQPRGDNQPNDIYAHLQVRGPALDDDEDVYYPPSLAHFGLEFGQDPEGPVYQVYSKEEVEELRRRQGFKDKHGKGKHMKGSHGKSLHGKPVPPPPVPALPPKHAAPPPPPPHRPSSSSLETIVFPSSYEDSRSFERAPRPSSFERPRSYERRPHPSSFEHPRNSFEASSRPRYQHKPSFPPPLPHSRG